MRAKRLVALVAMAGLALGVAACGGCAGRRRQHRETFGPAPPWSV
jgi:hypothetical protein